MFTIDQIKQAHAKVKSGADFPKYIQEIKLLGVKSYDTYVRDGHSEYAGNTYQQISSDAKYAALEIAQKSKPQEFITYLKNHQQGQSDYMTFCKQSAETGIEKWTVDIDKMTCTYFDKANSVILIEQIPVG